MRKLLLPLAAAVLAAAAAEFQAKPDLPGGNAVQNNLGVALMFQGKYREARAAFAKAGNRLNQGIALLAARQTGDAERAF